MEKNKIPVIIEMHDKLVTLISKFTNLLNNASDIVELDAALWQAKAKALSQESDSDVIMIEDNDQEQPPSSVNDKTGHKSVEESEEEEEENKDKKEKKKKEVEKHKEIESSDEEVENGSKAEENSDPKKEVKMPFLRVRNVDELNKVMSEDKTGEFCAVKSEGETSDEAEDGSRMAKVSNDGHIDKNEKPKDKSVISRGKCDDLSTDHEESNGSHKDSGYSEKTGKKKEQKKIKNRHPNRKDSLVNGETVADMNRCKEDSKGGNKSIASLSSVSESEKENENNMSEGSKSTDHSIQILSSLTSSETTNESDTSEVFKPSAKGSPRKKSDKKNLSPSKNSVKKQKNVLDSDEEVSRLLDTKSLKKRKRAVKSSDSDCSSQSQRDKKKQRTVGVKKKKKIVGETSDSSDDDKSGCEGSIDLNELVNSLPSMNEGRTKETFLSQALLETRTDSNSEGSSDIFSDEQEPKKVTKKKGSKKVKAESSEESDGHRKKSAWRNDRLLREKLSDTDSSDDERRWKEFKNKNSGEKKKVAAEKKKKRQKIFSSDSGSSSDSDKESGSDRDSESEKDVKKKKRRRIQRMSSESDSDTDAKKKCPDSTGKGRKNIRKMLKDESLEKLTQNAIKEEQERKKRISERQKLYNTMMMTELPATGEGSVEKVVLDFDAEEKKELVAVDEDLVKKMKPHQAEGVKFMWDACFESLKLTKKTDGSGCILAHCMGLGKTFQVISLIHTLVTHEETDVKTVLIVCPLSTVNNWASEFEKWLKDIGSGEDIDVFTIHKSTVKLRQYLLKDWHRKGGVMIMGYALFRNLSNPPKKTRPSVRQIFEETLLDPGPDLVICDEGHVLKNESTALSTAMSKLRTMRRIVLTGTPLQNNLAEYHCMVQFVKPNLLGNRKEFKNRFVNPITNGQFEDSTLHDVKVMKRRAHVLHKLLDGIVQRKDYNVLTPYLPQKYEYVISLVLSEPQCKLYQHYLDHFSRGGETRKGSSLFKDWQCLSRICSHPRVLLMHSDREFLKRLDDESEGSCGSLKDFIDDGSASDVSSTSNSSKSNNGSDGSKKKNSGSDQAEAPIPTRRTRANPGGSEGELDNGIGLERIERVERNEWWSSLITDEEMEDPKSSPKMVLLFTILKKCEEIGDKLLVFSQSLITLDLIEYFLKKADDLHNASGDNDSPMKEYASAWEKGRDYFRLDGSTATEHRTTFVSHFNNEKNIRARLFLISTRAGGLGINLVGANRVIIYDASWNPSDDVQSIFRIYRFGQHKPCYIYRFLAQGTMEEKIYDRQIAKLSVSRRVVDEQQVDRHFSHSDLFELYSFEPQKMVQKGTPMLPKDRLMAELLQMHSNIISTHHQHDSLLQNVEEEGLNEEERKLAWQDFENEKNAPPPPVQQELSPADLFITIAARLRQQNPYLSEELLQQNARKIFHTYQNAMFSSTMTMAQPAGAAPEHNYTLPTVIRPSFQPRFNANQFIRVPPPAAANQWTPLPQITLNQWGTGGKNDTKSAEGQVGPASSGQFASTSSSNLVPNPKALMRAAAASKMVQKQTNMDKKEPEAVVTIEP